jgi:hypothetical protein
MEPMASSRIIVRDFRDYRRDHFVDAQTSTSARLAPTLLLTNEMGVSANIPQTLGADDRARVEFDVPSADVKSAELIIYIIGLTKNKDNSRLILVNGNRIKHHPKEERRLTGGWDRATIPARYLKKGTNEIIFCDGMLHVDPGPGGKSSRSFDGGDTWHVNALGAGGDLAGEYMVRLRLKGFAPRGELVSPVFDLADADGTGIAPRVDLSRVGLTCEKTAPRGTRIDFEMRSGSTPAFSAREWTSWEAQTSIANPGRFTQWRAVLSSNSAAASPALKSVSLKVDYAETRGSLKGVDLIEADQPEIVYSSYDFDYLAPHFRVDRLIKQYRLHDVIADGKTEIEKLELLRDWIHSQWLGWQAVNYPYCPPWDPIEILETTKGNWGFGMCTHYGAVFAGCASALGWVARVLIVDHHCLAEVWSDDLQKWILQDAGPGREHDAQYESRGVPVNAVEFHRLHEAGKAHTLTINKLPNRKKEKMTKAWGRLFSRFGIPLRNNHLYQAEPAELSHGYNQYHWDGYLWWSVDADPKYSEYSLQTSREADFNWSVNQTRLYPRAGVEAGVLEIDVETATPNFSHYQIKIDGSEWDDAEAPLSWSLSAGENELEVRGVNAFGKAGRSARLKVGYAG